MAHPNQKNWNSNSPERRAEYRRRYQERHPDTIRAKYHRDKLRKFGMTPEQYQELLDVQDGVCAICEGVEPNGKRLAVDHCHLNGHVRGLLCSKCNWALAQFDQEDRLWNVMAYLAIFPKQT